MRDITDLHRDEAYQLLALVSLQMCGHDIQDMLKD